MIARMQSADANPRVDALRPLRYLVRVPLLLLHVVVALPVTVALISLPDGGRRLRNGESLRQRMIRAWQGGLLRIFGLRPRRVGAPLPGAALFVANHVSWIDITLLHSQHAVGFVAKSEIARWPLVGWMANRAGTIYHRRGNENSLRDVMEQCVVRLRAGQPVGVFPEGGTGDGQNVRVFHARILQAAVDADVPVQPVALGYGEHASAQTQVAFARGESFGRNFLRLLGERGRVVEVQFLQPIAPVSGGRRGMAENARAQIAQALDR
ncbi:MAG: 1-acyl-sn-glycerol-3-phosphate acyltransferase [Proteobacteria bacterium]|nr:1-acyl-sn-glycerol-3-phosphate acyltransferase [Pseudomonadota bacterium]